MTPARRREPVHYLIRRADGWPQAVARAVPPATPAGPPGTRVEVIDQVFFDHLRDVAGVVLLGNYRGDGTRAPGRVPLGRAYHRQRARFLGQWGCRAIAPRRAPGP